MSGRTRGRWVGSMVLLAAAALVAPVAALAHTGAGPADSLAYGLGHPLGGLDHLAAMLGVGAWAAQLGGRRIWAMPLTFIMVMSLSGAIGAAGIGLPFVESGIAASVLVLGVLVAAAARWPLLWSSLLVGLFAIFHGHAHGAEVPAAAAFAPYGAGFVLATALLHGCGAGFGLLARKTGRPRLIRYAGGMVAAFGIYLLIG